MSHLIDRDEELQLLLQAYERTKQSGAKPPRPSQEFVLIRGIAGTGKTALALSLQQNARQDGGFFLQGKFDLTTTNQVPYAAFNSLFQQFMENLLGENGEPQLPNEQFRLSFVQKAIREAVGPDGRLLTDKFPSLERLMGPQEDPPVVPGRDARNHFLLIISRFWRAVAAIAPVVLFLDDLQWSDNASLDLVHALLQTPLGGASYANSSLFMIGAYRDEGMDNNESPEGRFSENSARQSAGIGAVAYWDQGIDLSQHSSTGDLLQPSNAGNLPELPLHSRLRIWEKLNSNGSLSLTEIGLQNLDEVALNSLLAGFLEQSPDATAGLGTVVYSKCQGNPFYAVQLLQYLIKTGRIQKDEEQDQWLWDNPDVLECIRSPETVNEMLRQKLLTLPQLSLLIMKLAALMSDEIDMSAISTYFNETDISNLELALQAAARDGHLTFERQQDRYKFVNDRIRQTVLSMIDDKDEMSFQIGYKLWKQSSPGFLSTKLLVVASLLNHGTTKLTDQSDRYKAASLNLEAGVKATSLAIFSDASQYFKAGIEFMNGADYWKDEYKLALSLFSAAADAEVSNHDFDRVSDLAAAVFQHASSIEDRMVAHFANIISTGQHGSVRAATEEGFNVLCQLGENLPRKKNIVITTEVFKTKAVLRCRSNESLLKLPPMQDEQKIAAMHLMCMLLPYAYQAAPCYVSIIGTHLVRSCLRYGIHKDSAVGFVAFGWLVCRTNRSEGYRLGNLALTLVEKLRARELIPRVHHYFYGFIHHWKRPLKQSLEFLENAERVGMEIGDIEYAIFALNFRCNHAFCTGMPLSQLEALLVDATEQMQLYKQRNMLELNRPLLQYIHNLTGRAPDPKLLCGDIVSLYDPLERADNLFIPYAHYLYGADLAFMFGDHELAEEMLERKRGLQFEPLGCYIAALDSFKEALISITQARLAINKRKNIRIAKRSYKQMRRWALDCEPNFLNKQRLIEAELNGLAPHRQVKRHILAMYDEAIASALQEDFVHEAALACELAGYYLQRHNDNLQGMSYLEKACGYYQRWGATEKTTELSSKISRPSQS